MPDLNNLPHFLLKIIFTFHLILVTCGIQGSWCPKSVMFYNLLFFACILWAVHNAESDKPLQFAIFINTMCMFFDVVTLSVYYLLRGVYDIFTAAFLIINLIVRPITSIYLLRIGQGRGGALATVFPPIRAMDLDWEDYGDISHLIPQNADFDGI